MSRNAFHSRSLRLSDSPNERVRVSRTAAVVLPLFLLLACRSALPLRAARVTVPIASPSTSTLQALQRRVNSALAEPSLAGGTWGLEVRSLRSGETLVDVGSHRLLMPASTLKAITLAVAADRLGWDFTFGTRLQAKGTIANGELSGDLIVVGTGDPSFDDWDGAASQVFQSWAEELKEHGVTSVTGRIIGDDHAFAENGYGRGWMWDDMADGYSAPASGLHFNQGVAQMLVAPGSSVGAPATLSIEPAYAPLSLVGHVRTERASAPTAVSVEPVARSAAVMVKGSIAVDSQRETRSVAIANPTQYFVNAVRAGLLANGIDVRGSAVDVDDISDAPAPDVASIEVATHRSAPLPALGETMMRLSQNLYAESLLLTVGSHRGGSGTAEAGIATISDVLASWGVAPTEVLMADGSGLSRYDLVTADAVVSILAHVFAEDRLRDSFIATLPVAGRPGMLSSRMRGTAAEANVRAKTGSFTNARAIAGFVQSADGEPLVFSIMANNYGVPPAAVDRVADAILVALAEFHRQ